MDVAGPSSLMLFYAAVLAALALYSFQRPLAAPPVPPRAEGGFCGHGRWPQAVLQMDPGARFNEDGGRARRGTGTACP